MNIDTYLKHLEVLTKTKVSYADVFNNYGLALASLKRDSEALRAFARALQINARYVDASVGKSFVLAEQGHVAQAFRDLKRLHVRSPHDMRVLLALGIFCMRHGWNESGLAQLRMAARTNPSAPYLLAYEAAALLEMGDEKAAKAQAEKAKAACRDAGIDIEADGEKDVFLDFDTYRRWENPYVSLKFPVLFANFLAEHGNLDAALEEFQRINSTFPGHIDVMIGLGRVAMAKDKSDEARSWFERTAVANPESHVALINLGFSDAERDELDKALEKLQRAVELRPLFPDYRYHLGTLLLDLDRTEEAVIEFKRSLTMNPQYGIASVQLARAHLVKGDAQAAIASIAEGFCHNWPEALLVEAEAYSAAGEIEEAIKSLKKALSIDPSYDEASDLLKSLTR